MILIPSLNDWCGERGIRGGRGGVLGEEDSVMGRGGLMWERGGR